MKTKLSLTILFSFVFGLLTAQVPQGFNYQAIARDGSGNILANTPLQAMIYIQSLSSGGTVFWKELHSGLTTNSFGLFTIVVGTGTRQTESTIAEFDLIDWSVTPKYLKSEIYYSDSWKDMGTSQLLAVPYSMVAEDLAGSVNKLSIEGNSSELEDALFEVKNKDGQTVFAVYNEGVRIYVSDGAKALKGGFAVGGFGTDKAESTKYFFVGKDSVRIYLDNNPLTKGLKSGFAVGGYDLTKGTIQNYLDVSADSVRIYIDNNPEGKRAKGGFAVGGYDLTKGIVQDYLDVSSDSVRIYIDSDPTTKKAKGGFAVGGYDLTKGMIQDYLDVSPDSVRVYIDDTGGSGKGKKGGFAVGGFDMTKSGNASFLNVEIDTLGKIDPSRNRIVWYPLKNAFLAGKVLIEIKDSVGENSFSSGYESKSIGDWSQALGYKAIARGNYSTSIGKNSIANKINSFAFGEDATAKMDETYAIGRGAVASGYRSFAIGSAGVDSAGNPTDVTRAIGDYSFAIGQGSQSLGFGSFAMGLANIAGGDYSTVLGTENNSSGNNAIAMGFWTSANGECSTAFGYCTKTTGFNSTAMGEHSSASGGNSVAMGKWSSANGAASLATGRWTVANGDYSVAMGNEASTQGSCSFAMGNTVFASGSVSVALGSMSSATGESSIVMGHKCFAVGGLSFVRGSYSDASGYHSTAIGNNLTAPSYCETVIGKANTTYTPLSADSWEPSDRLFVIGNGTDYTNTSNAITVLKNGNVGLGTSTPDYTLTVNGTAWSTSGAWSGSDLRWKKNIEPISEILSKIVKLEVVNFNWRMEEYPDLGFDNDKQIGLIAQDVEILFPELVKTDKDGYKAVSYEKLSVILLEGLKEQQQKIESTELENQQLKSQLQILQAKVDKIEVLLSKTIDK